MKLAFLLLLPALLLPAGPPPPPPRTGATALSTATRREADSLRVWVSWPAARAAPTALRFSTVAPGGRETRWPDSVTLRPAGSRLLTFTMAVAHLPAAADRLRLREPGPDAPAPTDVPVAATAAARTRTYALADSGGRIVTRAWVRTDEILRPATFGLEVPLTLLRYTADFQPALPPMVTGGGGASATLTVADTRDLSPTDTFRIRRPGLYALRQGAAGGGSGGGALDPLLVEDGGFPDVRTAPDLIRPLIYLTTAQERQALYDAPEPKKATDTFWLTVAKDDPTVARALIRTYYGRVAEANRLFTAHKPGWMTDRGMLWIVLGPPPRVDLLPDGEDWVYRDVAATSGARFRFQRRPSLFAPDHYALRRERSFEEVWYAAAGQWRQGRAVTAAR